MDRGNEQRAGYRQWRDYPAHQPMGKGPAQLFDGIPRVLAELLKNFDFNSSGLAKCWFCPWADGRWGGWLIILRGIAGALPASDVFRFGNFVKTGELIWVRLIYWREGLFWFSQNIHDGFPVGVFEGERIWPTLHGPGRLYLLELASRTAAI
jgi:hypothetical protein